MQKQNKRSLLLTLAFLSVVPTVAHLAYSWMGFSPTDQGFTLAYSRRLLEGQIPHLDFIIIRPPLSPLIHTPFVLFGGEYTYWLSRFFVWFQYAIIAWVWVSAVNHAFGRIFGAPMKVLLGAAVFAATAHHFVLTAWHTIDGMFLASIGVWLLVTRPGTGSRFSGYLLVAAAYLTKQSFILMPPLFLLVLGDWRRPKYLLASAIPGLLYIAYLLATGAFPDAYAQLTSQTGIFSVGVISYLNYAVALGAVAGAATALPMVVGERLSPERARLAEAASGIALVGLPAAFITVGMIIESLSTVAFGIFGIMSGAMAVLLGTDLYRRRFRGGRDRARSYVEPGRMVLLALVLAWSVSLSFGYNTPGLALGLMLLVLIALAYPGLAALSPRLVRATLVGAGLAVILSFGWSRTEYIYREQPAGQLTEPVADVLPGGRLIYTNPTTYAFLEDFREGRRIAEERGKEYAVIPQVAGHWPQAEQTNPLPLDWPWSVELGSEELNDRVKRDLDAERGEVVILAQKTDAFDLADDPQPATNETYEILEYVRENWEKTGETEYFELYE